MSSSKILIVASNFPPVRGGSASVYASLASKIRETIVVLAPMFDYADGLPLIGWREHDRSTPYRVVRVPLLRTVLIGVPIRRKWMWRLQDLWIRTRVLSAVLREIISSNVRCVCVGELVASGWLLKLLRWFPGITTAVYVHGEEITTSLSSETERGRIRSSLIASDIIIAVSRFTLDITAGLVGPEYRSRITLIQNGVDVEKFFPGNASAALRADYGLQSDIFIFISVSRLVEKKGHDKAIMAFKTVVQEFPDTLFLIVGDGPYRGTLERIVDRLELASQVRFVGSVPEDELADHYKLGNVFIMPNRALPDGDTEGFGLVFLEANGCGLPVIAGQDGGSLEAVTDGFNGLTVNGNSETDVSAAMLRLRRDAALRATLKANGLVRARAFDWRSRADVFLKLCKPS